MSARPAFTATSASPFEFSYQNASPVGTSENVRRRASTRPAYGESRLVRDQRRPQARHRVAESVDVNNLGKVVRPIGMSADPSGQARPPGGTFAAGEQPRYRGEQVVRP